MKMISPLQLLRLLLLFSIGMHVHIVSAFAQMASVIAHKALHAAG